MDITSEWLDEQIATATREAEVHKQNFHHTAGVIAMAECLKAHLAKPEPEPEKAEEAESDASNIVPLNDDQNP